MRKLLKGNIAQKIIIVLIVAILCNFIIPNYSHAIDGDDVAGVLGLPIRTYLTFIGDCAVTVIHKFMVGEFIGAAWADAKPVDNEDSWNKNLQGEIAWPTILISPEEIITGKVSILNANFIKGSSDKDADGDDVKGDDSDYFANIEDLTIDQYRVAISSGKKVSTSDAEEGIASLRTTISQWYNLLRNISAAALFCVLIYMGIRMVLSSISDEKAKYKKMMLDWLTAICILFFLHYIMAIIMYSTEKIVDVIGNGLSDDGNYKVMLDKDEQKFIMTKPAKGTSPEKEIKPYNLMELVRVYISAHDQTIAFSYLLIYFALIAVTFIFIYKYLKRFMTMALLTLIAPLIAVTYPIDKVKDGQAQAFSMWLREYIFNALMQPIHLLIYMVLIGSAMDLVKSNIIYGIVAMVSILPAEKLIKSMFGFDKASTTDGIGNFAKGAVFAKAASALAKGGKSSSKSGSGTSKIRQTNNKPDSGKDSIGIGDAYGNSEENPGLGVAFGNLPSSGNGNSEDNTELGATFENSSSNEEQSMLNHENINMESMNKESNETERNSNNTGRTENNSHLDIDTNESKPRVAKNSARTEKKAKRKIKMGKVAKGVGNVIGTGAKYVNKNKGTILKAGLKSAGGLAGAAFGAGAAIVTGDISHIATGAAAGIGVGAGVGSVGSGIANAGRGIRSAYRGGALGEDATEKLERYEAFIKDKENIEAFQKQFKNADGSRISRSQAKEKIEEARDFIEAGYTDAKEIKKLMKMRDSNINVTSTQAMAAHQQAEKYGPDYFMDDKKIDNLENDLTRQLEAKGMKTETARANAQKHINLMAMSQGRAEIKWDIRKKEKEQLADEQAKAAEKAKIDAERNAKFQEAIIDLANSSKGKKRRRR